jgi:hypothetical protein
MNTKVTTVKKMIKILKNIPQDLPVHFDEDLTPLVSIAPFEKCVFLSRMKRTPLRPARIEQQELHMKRSKLKTWHYYYKLFKLKAVALVKYCFFVN